MLDGVGGGRQAIEAGVGPRPRPHVAATPTGLIRQRGVAAQEPGDARGVTHLERGPSLAVKADAVREEFAERAAAGGVGIREILRGQIAVLVATDEPAVIGRIRLDDPKLRMMHGEVMVGVRAPLLVRSANVVDPQLGQDVGGIVQCLRQVLDAAPDQDVQRTGIVAPGAADDPRRALGRLAEAGVGRRRGFTLRGDGPQGIGIRVMVRPSAQVGIVVLVACDHLKEMFPASRAAAGRRDQSLEVEHVGIEQHMDHRLEVIEIGAADVGGDDDPMAVSGHNPGLGGSIRRGGRSRRLAGGEQQGGQQAAQREETGEVADHSK